MNNPYDDMITDLITESEYSGFDTLDDVLSVMSEGESDEVSDFDDEDDDLLDEYYGSNVEPVNNDEDEVDLDDDIDF